ncbi:MAG: F0F1 ATP synthase subunit B [Candidatus Daviesbacteria bacterium]|nr:F0F1 ATP synthase subunit B [Candidatus Daviesbacteria bacterium]
MEFFENFGVQPILLAAQVVNFLILLFLLKKFLYKPILKVLEERSQKIAQSLKNAEEIEKRLVSIEKERDEVIQKMDLESQRVINEATKTASLIIAEAHQKAARDVLKIVANAQKSMEEERNLLHREIRSELANLVVLGLQKVAGKVLTEKEKKELVDKSLKDLAV